MVKEILELSGLDRKQLAECADMSYAQVCELVNKKKPTLEMFVRLADAAGIPLTIGGRKVIYKDGELAVGELQETPEIVETGYILMVKYGGHPIKEAPIPEMVTRLLGQRLYPHQRVSGTWIIWGYASELEEMRKKLANK